MHSYVVWGAVWFLLVHVSDVREYTGNCLSTSSHTFGCTCQDIQHPFAHVLESSRSWPAKPGKAGLLIRSVRLCLIFVQKPLHPFAFCQWLVPTSIAQVALKLSTQRCFRMLFPVRKHFVLFSKCCDTRNLRDSSQDFM
jgi:hypothetical protein